MRKKTLFFILLSFLWVSLTYAQTKKITGKVTFAEDNEPVIGASVSVKKTALGTATNIEGSFSLDVPVEEQTLVFSYIGMKTQEVDIRGKSVVDVVLEADVSVLDEVIVVAYGTTTKASYTGSASKVGSDVIDMRPITNITQALSGAIAGVQVGNNSGQPGTGPTIRIRGISSINDANNPLYVVDGVPYENALSSISPDDIESLTFLKDATSAALYGSRAAAGVVIVTTKKGQKGKPTFNIKATQSFSKVGMEFYDTVSPEEFYVLNWEKLRNQYGISQTKPKPVPMDIAAKLASGTLLSYEGNSYKSIYNELGYNPFNVANDDIVREDGTINPNAKLRWGDDLDWMSAVRQLGLREEYMLSYSGANDNTNYYVSSGYLNERGYMKSSSFNRITARANINSQLTNWFKTGLNFNGNISDGTSPTGNSPYYYPLYIGPIYPVHLHDPVSGEYILDKDGNKKYDYGIGDYGMMKRPINSSHHTVAELEASKETYRRSLLAAKTYAEFKFLKDFTFTLNYSADLNTYYSANYTPVLEGTATPGELTKQTSQRLTWNFNQLLQYKKTIDKHSIDALAGHEAYSTGIFDMLGTRRNQIVEGIAELANYSELNDLTSSTSVYNLESYLGRINYAFDDKYLASFSFRRDGSSKFYINSRWGDFWSAGLAWRIDRESFINVFFLDMLKLRSSYGMAGNDSGIGYFAWQSLYSMYPNAGVPGYAITSLGNQRLHWETNVNFDVALEFSLFKRLSGSIEYFNKESNDMLYNMPLHPSSGFSNLSENAFSMYNRGIEIELGFDILKSRNGFNWKVRMNATHYKNLVMEMPVEPYRNGTKKIETGHSIYDFNLRHFMGVDPKTGLTMYTPDPSLSESIVENLPKTEDGTTYTTDDAQAGYFWTGKSAIPKIYGGISTDFSWKDIMLSIRTSYQFGGYIYDANYRTLMTWTSAYGRTFHKDMLRRWQKKDDITDVPRLDATDGVATDQAASNTDRWLVSSDYFELSSVNLSYNLPKKITNYLNVQRISLYGTGELMYRYTKRKGLNVRYSYNGTVDDGYLPATTYTLGVTVTF